MYNMKLYQYEMEILIDKLGHNATPEEAKLLYKILIQSGLSAPSQRLQAWPTEKN